MRTLLLLAIGICFLNSAGHGQTYEMHVNLDGGEVIVIPIADIQRIDLPGDCTSVDDGGEPSPASVLFELMQNHPNPFNPSTAIEYRIPRAAHVNVSVFDIGGRLVKEILDDTQPAGLHQVTWDGTDITNTRVASGIYFYTVESDNQALSKKMILLY
jgi:hypothetical protein